MTRIDSRWLAVLLLLGCGCAAWSAGTNHDFAKWEKEIAVYEQMDRTNPPPKDAVLFIGSSTIRRWQTLAQEFPGHRVINRGFGGSEIADAAHFADRIVFPYEPRQIFLRAGGNDLHAGRLPGEVADDFADFVQKVHARLPKTEILFISLSPAPARWSEKDKARALNRLIRKLALRKPRVGYVDTYGMSLESDGGARHELFADDKLHFNFHGYEALADLVRPYLSAAR